jgi:hypothetical protein
MFRSGLLFLPVVLFAMEAKTQAEYNFPSEQFIGLDTVPFFFKPWQRMELSQLDSLINYPGKIKSVEIPTAKIPETFTDAMPNGWSKTWILPFIPNSIPVVPIERK